VGLLCPRAEDPMEISKEILSGVRTLKYNIKVKIDLGEGPS